VGAPKWRELLSRLRCRLPDYAVAIDVYDGAGADAGTRWVHIAEYAPPAGIDPAAAEQRLRDVLAIVPEVLGADAENVFLKRRERQRGLAQYERMARSGVVGTIAERDWHRGQPD
jgi:23S rRNA (guanine2445-N2)-methyltransferase / 23S rRNA (guanine2069-N7)-methyltransferase